MKTDDFLRTHHACQDCARWARAVSVDMADVWDAMVRENKHDWLLWTATCPGVFSGATLRRLACQFVRATPLPDGRTVWDLLDDERSRHAVEVAERYADGLATDDELAAACDAACDATWAAAGARACDAAWAAAWAAAWDAACDAGWAAAWAAAWDAAWDAARVAARDAGWAAACDAAWAAQVRMISELGNPFRKDA